MELLVEGRGYVIFEWGDGVRFYIYTSLNPEFCKTSEEALFDLHSNRWLEKRLFQDAIVTITLNKPEALEFDSLRWMEMLGLEV